jgi:phosphotransferase system HPr (HPr) family protein
MPIVSQRATVTVTILNKLGLHARPAMTFVEHVAASNSTVTVKRADNTEVVDGGSIMQLMMLAATQGTKLEITAEGDDAKQTIKNLETLIEQKFDEE